MNRYSSLSRELDLQGSPGPFFLEEAVIPVVLIHEHCEGERQGTGAFNVGAIAAGDWGVPFVIPKAGAYQVSGGISAAVAVGLVGSTQNVMLTDRPVGSAPGTLGRTLMSFSWGVTQMTSIQDTFVIPKVHFDEGREMVWVSTALAVNDLLDVFALCQPV
jgi:hypothetical protein